MSPLIAVHIGFGLMAIAAGTVAGGARKGSRLHGLAGSWFAGSMLALGVTVTVIARLMDPPQSGLGGILICYFVATSWMAARRRNGTTGAFEKIACAIALGGGGLCAYAGFAGIETASGRGPLFGFAVVCLLAGLLDLNAILRGKLTAAQRLSRHLWRMCFAFFSATGSFFLGQQDVMPKMVQGSPVLWVLALAPLGLMIFWLVRLRLRSPAPIRLARAGA